VANAIGGGSTVNPGGSITAPTYTEGQITNVAAGMADTDAVNVAQLKATGLVSPNGTTNAAVTYDHNADGSTDHRNVTIGDAMAGGTTIHNVATGTTSTDAVNVGQLNPALSTVANIANNASNPMFTADGNRDTAAAVAGGTHATAMSANEGVGRQPGGAGCELGGRQYGVRGRGWHGASDHRRRGRRGRVQKWCCSCFGATYRSENSRWLTNVAAFVTSTGHAGVRVQVGYEFQAAPVARKR
jgi:autotransporter adhesin